MTIENNTIEGVLGSDHGIRLANITSSAIRGNTVNGTGYPGISILAASFTTIERNRVTNGTTGSATGGGIELGGDATSPGSRNLTIRENDLRFNDGGLLLSGENITHNGRNLSGVWWESAGGAVLEESHNVTLNNSTIHNNTGWGLEVFHSKAPLFLSRIAVRNTQIAFNGNASGPLGAGGGAWLHTTPSWEVAVEFSGTSFFENKPQDIATDPFNVTYTLDSAEFGRPAEPNKTRISANASRNVNITRADEPENLTVEHPGNASLTRFLNMTKSDESGFISLTFFYDPLEVAARGITDESALRLWHYNNTTQTWARIDDSVPDPENNSVYANLTDFSIVAFESPRPVDLAPGAPAVVEFRELPEVAAIRLEAKAAVSGVLVESFRLSGRPAQIAADPPGRPYAFLAIEPQGVANDRLESAEVEFKVKRSWLAENDIDPETVVLNRFNGGWESYAARLVEEGDAESRYAAEVPGFSVFAISGEPRKETPTPSPEPISPPAPPSVVPPLPSPTPRPAGFGIVAAVAALGAGMLLQRRKR